MHTDLVGPMQVTSIGGSTYFMTFDDFSHRTWVYFLNLNLKHLVSFLSSKPRLKENVDIILKS